MISHKIRRGDVFYADLSDDQEEGIQAGARPVVVTQSNWLNLTSPTVIVACLTTQLKNENIECHFVLNLSRDNETNLNEYVRRSVLGQKVVVRGSDYNRSRIISRIKELDGLMEKLSESSVLSSDEVAELHVIKEIRRNWDVEKETA